MASTDKSEEGFHALWLEEGNYSQKGFVLLGCTSSNPFTRESRLLVAVVGFYFFVFVSFACGGGGGGSLVVFAFAH